MMPKSTLAPVAVDSRNSLSDRERDAARKVIRELAVTPLGHVALALLNIRRSPKSAPSSQESTR